LFHKNSITKLDQILEQIKGGRSNPTAKQFAGAEKLGVDPKWVKPDGSIDWPPNDGFASNIRTPVELQPGQRFDRYGGRYDVKGNFVDQGSYASPLGVPFEQRALPDSTLNSPHKTYEIFKPIPGVQSGTAAPWFDKPGGGTQYQMPLDIKYLIENKFIKEVK